MAKRNAKCPCGSGKKYKLCHGKRPEKERSRKNNFTLVVAAIAIVAAAIFGVTSVLSSGPVTDGEGRVWSAEHGHWHDASGREPRNAPPSATLPPIPGSEPAPGSSAPPGPPPRPGQVWSPEHNHWH